jgi:hypothetical protein
VNIVKNQQQKVEAALKAAGAKDSAIVAKGTSGMGGAVKTMGGRTAQDSGMNADKANNAAAAQAARDQANNARSLVEPMNSCAEEIEENCKESDVGPQAAQQAKKVANACKKGAQAAQQAAAQKDGDAQKMASNGDKDGKNGQGLQPPQMPQMPQMPQQEKPSDVASNTDTATSAPVAASGLGGNQLGGQSVGIGTGEKATDPTTASATGYGGRNFGASGISTGNDPLFAGAGNFGGGSGGKYGSSGASSMGGGFGGGTGTDGSAEATQAAVPPQPQKQEDIEAFSNGGARPSYLGMKSKGGELADLGLDIGNGNAAASTGDSAEDGDRSLASTDQGAGATAEDQRGSLFNMIHTRLEEIGRRGSI